MEILENEELGKHSTFKIGGPAKYYAIPSSVDEVKEAIEYAKDKNLPYLIIGKGSNILFHDRGYDGVVIEIGSKMQIIERIDDLNIRAEAGTSLSALSNYAANASLAGLEFAAGIPGTVGGGVTMNAGAYGGEIVDCIQSATVLDKDGNVRVLQVNELDLSYRSSIIQKEDYIVLDATFQLIPGDENDIRATMRDYNGRRRDKQPLEYASAGSTFKRPKDNFAGKLIEDAGLKGYSVGDAQVSEKHCGFVVNKGNATYSDVKAVIEHVQKVVKEQFDVELETEVKIV
ncbi:UDP-N-acetylmuramate dehydrogenase [Eubacterium xylanophilum]|uniref:UDP-N-acetylmuramate dehydrogenase n=1 Tax=Eubacterium xylanophilum TaxID=39497 RepID=UPI0004B72F90|nr:UDP-N-acetylmuramate dehydrogenase [Eubacterium xylanophilum]